MPENSTALPLAWTLGAYFLLQIILNLRLRGIARLKQDRSVRLLRSTFANSVINSLFFIAAALLLIFLGLVPQPALPSPAWPWLLASLPAGLFLWALRIRLLGIGQRISGGSAFVQPAEHLLRNPGDLGQLNRAAMQISLLEPLGNELMFRACFLALMNQIYGMWPAILATAVVELLLRLNPAWALAVLGSSLLLSAVSLLGGGPLASVCTALVAGFLHSYITAYQALRAADSGAADLQQNRD